MKYIIILLIAFCIGCTCSYTKGYCNGYDEAKEIYTSYYGTLLDAYKHMYEYVKEEYFKNIQTPKQ